MVARMPDVGVEEAELLLAQAEGIFRAYLSIFNERPVLYHNHQVQTRRQLDFFHGAISDVCRDLARRGQPKWNNFRRGPFGSRLRSTTTTWRLRGEAAGQRHLGLGTEASKHEHLTCSSASAMSVSIITSLHRALIARPLPLKSTSHGGLWALCVAHGPFAILSPPNALRILLTTMLRATCTRATWFDSSAHI
jgi:hypothetical protein